MRFYTKQHTHSCGIDLDARWMYLCIMDQSGKVLLHRNMRATPEAFLKAVAPYREDLVVAVECMLGCTAHRAQPLLTSPSTRLCPHSSARIVAPADSHRVFR